VAVLFFLGTIAPALGFLDIFFMRYAYVADHFQYWPASPDCVSHRLCGNRVEVEKRRVLELRRHSWVSSGR